MHDIKYMVLKELENFKVTSIIMKNLSAISELIDIYKDLDWMEKLYQKNQQLTKRK